MDTSNLNKEDGFTLIEVIASVVIISIILISFSQLFVSTNKIAATNNDKLVTINLADAVLAKVKSYNFAYNPTYEPKDYFIDLDETNKRLKNPPEEIIINNKTYSITYQVSQSEKLLSNAKFTEKQLGLIRVIVTVTSPNGKTKGSSEGYVLIE